jgi:hypothetical protein
MTLVRLFPIPDYKNGIGNEKSPPNQGNPDCSRFPDFLRIGGLYFYTATLFERTQRHWGKTPKRQPDWGIVAILVSGLVSGTQNKASRTNPDADKCLIYRGFLGVTPPGFEPGTNGLKVHCSAVELEGRAALPRAAIHPTPMMPPCAIVCAAAIRSPTPARHPAKQ